MKRLISGVLMFAVAISVSAQYSQIYSNEDVAYANGIELYQQGQYEASYAELYKYHGANYAEEAAFYLAANAFELRHIGVQAMLQNYIASHSYSPYASEVNFMIGALQVERKKNKQALKSFEKVDEDELFRTHKPDYLFYRGYALLKMNQPQQAANWFYKLKSEKSKYSLQAKYYYAFSQYTIHNYGKALPDFLDIEHTAMYKNIVPYYIIQIYYAQGQLDEVYERAEYLLSNDPKNEYNGELHRMLGEISYQKANYDKAAQHLSEYEKLYTTADKQLVRNDIYLLGMSYFQLKDWQNAVKYLSKLKKEDDEMTQNACFHLGQAYKELKQTEQAKMSFAAAMRYEYNEQLAQEAMYNYALTTYQSSSALGESVNAFTDFLEKYPESKYKEQVYTLLSDAFLNSKNYSAALEALEKINNPNRQMQQTKQHLRFQLGADAYMQGKNNDAVEWFTRVIDNETTQPVANNDYLPQSYFFRAEAEYRLQQYEQAQEDLQRFLQQAEGKQIQNKVLADYSMAYTHFSQKHYEDALKYFLNYIKYADQKDATYADALNRIGDCYFNARDFANAENYYSKVIALGAAGADYAMFQRGYVLGLVKRYGDKIIVLERLVKQYPKSDYADDALYEIARAELQRQKNDNAIEAYSKLLSTYPHSNLARKAALEKGMIYYNEKKYDLAIETYKQVIKNYPGSQEAYSALDGLEAAYIETDNVAEYLAYTKNLGKINMKTDSKEDSLTFVAAERQYMIENYQQAIAGLSKYLSQYCQGGRYCTMAQYYVADSYYRLNQKAEAIVEYKKLSEISGNPYMEEALTRVAEISYDNQDYQTSLDYFKRLQLQASSIDKINMARLGVLRCSYFLKDNQTTINIASQIIEDVSSKADVVAEARYNRGKAYIEVKEYDLAIEDLSQVAKEVRSAQGAEAKYLVALLWFQLDDIDKSENEIMSFAAMNTQQQYWLAKSFILLSDIYVHRNDLFQAKQYLLSLRSNYRKVDDIQQIVTEKLQLIEDKENEKITQTEDEDEE